MIVTSDSAFWEQMLDYPINERLGAAPQEVTDYVALVNSVLGLPERPVPVDAPDDFLADVRLAIAEMPAVVQHMLSTVLLGVVFARGLGSSAVTDIVVDQHGAPLGAVVALDLDAFLQRSANEWATWKENTPFAPAAGIVLQAVIAEDHDDNRKSALQYLLLHEFGHVLTAERGLIPNWWMAPQQMLVSAAYTFLPLAWEVTEAKQIVPLPGHDFAQRQKVVYYNGAQLSAEDMPAVYRALGDTGFATLYGATNVYDDFAESFVTYVHAVLMRKPNQISIRRNGKLVMAPEAYWDSPRSAARRAVLERFFATAPRERRAVPRPG